MKRSDPNNPNRTVILRVALPASTVELLKVLGPPAQVLATLADHVQQGVYRPGSWERPWLEQVFGYTDWKSKLEPDTERTAGDGRVIFDRPRRCAMKARSDTAMPSCVCPACGYAFDAATALQGGRLPKAGDVSVCLNCSAANVFTDALTVRAATPAEESTFGLEVSRVQLAIKRSTWYRQLGRRGGAQ